MRNFTLLFSAILVAGSFSLASAQGEPDPEILDVTVPGDAILDTDDPTAFEFAVTGGKAPYTFTFLSIDGAINESYVAESNSLTVPLSFSSSTSVLVDVTSNEGFLGHAVFDVTRINTGNSLTADFENIPTDGANWHGFTAADGGASYCYIYSGGVGFQNQYTPSWFYWSGTAVSGDLSTEFDPSNPTEGQYRNVTGSAYEGEQFGIHYYSSWEPLDIKVVGDDGNGMELQGVAVTNTCYTVNSILNGDSFAPAFADGDYLKLILTGNNDNGEPVELYLADYRDGKNFVLDNWEWLDLAPLDKVTRINVTMECTNEYTPTYFALDAITEKGSGINAVKVGKSSNVAIKVIGNSIQVSGLDSATSLRVYSLDGRQVLASEVSGERNVVNAAQLPAGSYIVSAAGTSAKFIKR